MSVLNVPESAEGIEMWKWEHHEGESHPLNPSIKGMRASNYKPYPAMMYKATQKNPWKFDYEKVADEHEQRNLESRGYVAGGRQAAADAFDAAQQNLAVMAAVRNYEDRNVSEKAREEINAAEQSSARHLGEIPETPIKRRGRKPKQS